MNNISAAHNYRRVGIAWILTVCVGLGLSFPLSISANSFATTKLTRPDHEPAFQDVILLLDRARRRLNQQKQMYCITASPETGQHEEEAISLTKLTEAFLEIKHDETNPFEVPEEPYCTYRSMKSALILDRMGIASKKVFVVGVTSIDHPFLLGVKLQWWWHTAPVVSVRKPDGSTEQAPYVQAALLRRRVYAGLPRFDGLIMPSGRCQGPLIQGNPYSARCREGNR